MEHSTIKSGILYVVATPIGNLADISQRAVEVLGQVDTILAEDTRHSRKLLDHLGLKVRLVSLCAEHERAKCEQFVEALQAGKRFALICDAGTPSVHDPGVYLVAACHREGIKLVSIPGANAAISALSVSGLPADGFIFAGFLSSRRQARLAAMKRLENEPKTLVFYEAPHRIQAFIEDASIVFGSKREAVVARELTKLYEQVIKASLGTIQEKLCGGDIPAKGEFVIVLAGSVVENKDDVELIKLLKILCPRLSIKDAVRVVQQYSGRRRNEVYRLACQFWQDR